MQHRLCSGTALCGTAQNSPTLSSVNSAPSVASCSSAHTSSFCFRAPAKLGSGMLKSADVKRKTPLLGITAALALPSLHPACSLPPQFLTQPFLSTTCCSQPCREGASSSPTADSVSGQHPPRCYIQAHTFQPTLIGSGKHPVPEGPLQTPSPTDAPFTPPNAVFFLQVALVLYGTELLCCLSCLHQI